MRQAGLALVVWLTAFAARAAEPAFEVPPGFVVERVAGSPLVRYPLFAALDDRGRLFVAEGTGTNLPGERLREQKLGRILLLEDTNGDGTFDKSRVFADQLVFPQGVLWHDGALYTASHPSLWRLEDPEDRGVATRRVELATGFGFNGNGCDIHGPFLGPDGRVYWTDGRHGYKVTTREGKQLEGLAARVWRCRPDGRDIERLCGGGFDNPVELDFTPDGEAIGTMDQGPGDCLLHYVEGGVYPMEHPCLKEFPITGPLLGAVKQYTPVLPAALCGFTRYRSSAFGKEFEGGFFSTHYMVHKVVRHELVRDGSTFRAEDHDFLTCKTHDVRLTDVLEDADGSLLLVDMGAWFTYGFLGNPLPKPEALGAIYRVRRTDAAKVADPWGTTLNILKRSPDELIALLQDARPKVRDQAVAQLAKRGAASVPALQAVVRARADRPAGLCRDAVWALCRIEDGTARTAVRAALTDPDESVRLAAIHAAGLWRDPEAASALGKLATNDTLPVRRKAAEALGRIGRPESVPALLAGLRAKGDRFLEHALIYALIQINNREATLPALGDADPHVRQAGLLALDQMANGRLTQGEVAPLVDSDDPDLQRTALEVVGRRPAWSALTQGVLRKWLAQPRLSESETRTVTDVLRALSGEADIQRVVAESVANSRTPVATRLLLLRVMTEGSLATLPAPWLDALGQALAAPDVTVRRAVIDTLKARGVYRFDRQLAENGRQTDLPADLRVAALECLAGRLGPPDPAAFDLLTTHLSATTDPLLRLAAARALAAGALRGDQLLRLAALTESTSTAVLRLLLPVFARANDSKVGEALVDALKRSPSAEVLSVVELDRTLQGYPPAVRERAKPLREKLAARERGKAAYLAGLTAELDALQGDADRGQEIFLSQKAACYGCHRAVGRGGTVGPDLSRIGQFRTRAELLESIVFPGLTIAPEFRSFQVMTKDGRANTGLVTRDAPDAITLRTTGLAEVRVPRDEIEEMAPSTTSLMPEGLEKTMTRQELRDVLEFLTTQR